MTDAEKRAAREADRARQVSEGKVIRHSQRRPAGRPAKAEADPREEAQALTDRIRRGLTSLWQDIGKAYAMRAWEHLGYDSWDAYVADEFESARWGIRKAERGPVVAMLRSQHGMSTRAIAAATGESQSTVQRTAREPQVSQNDSPQMRVTGKEGRSYPGSRLPKVIRQAVVPPAEELIGKAARELIGLLESWEPDRRNSVHRNAESVLLDLQDVIAAKLAIGAR
jgi:hypothetical protein